MSKENKRPEFEPEYIKEGDFIILIPLMGGALILYALIQVLIEML